VTVCEILTEPTIDEALSKIGVGLQKYCWIQNNIHKCDVSLDPTFQTRFNGFYKVRRDAVWRRQFYTLLETRKVSGITFPEALHALLVATSRLEASFASKLVATVHPDMPVIDKCILNNFRLRLPYYSSSNREKRCIDAYNQLCETYRALIGSAEGVMVCEKFLNQFSRAQITDIKKVDLVLWQIRDRNR
jgi:hypothetical protein